MVPLKMIIIMNNFLYRLDESPDLELLSVGDKVLEVNGVTVKEQSMDEVSCCCHSNTK